jgi:Tol biopolymer transport system component/DNA-binding winged helix-turn-helix (wHTH) protein
LVGWDLLNFAGTQPDRLPHEYAFSGFSLDALRGVLRRADEVIDLRSKSFEVLVYLVERHGELVTREELMRAIWPDVEVTDESITRCISDIRKALGDEPQQIIRTVPRRGYLFAAPVTIPVVEFPPRATPLGPEVLVPSGRVTGTHRHRWLATVVIGVLACLLGLLGWRASLTRNIDSEPPNALPISTLPGVVRYPTFSSDGNYVAFTWTGPKQDNPDVYVQQIGVGTPLRLTANSANDFSPAWSPDGRWIAFLRRHPDDADTSDVILIPPLGGPERKLTQIRVSDTYFVIPPYLSWCPDSSCLVVSNSAADAQPAALVELSLATGAQRSLTHPPPGAIGDTNPAISPDGRWLVFRRAINSRFGALYRSALGSAAGAEERLTEPILDAGYPAWMPDNKDILFSSEGSELRGSLWRLPVVDATPGGTHAARLPFVGADGIMPVVSKAPGKSWRLAYVRTFQDSNIWQIRTTGPGEPAPQPPAIAIASSRRDSTPQFSPDGHRVAFASDRSGSWEIWVADPDGSNAVRLTFFGEAPGSGAAAGAPAWSPSGDQIVFQANPEGQGKIYSVAAVGGKPRKLVDQQGNASRPSYSHNAEWVYFTSNRSGTREIWKVAAAGGEPIQVTSNGAFAAFESLDARFLYYNQSMDAPSPIWRVPTAGGTPVQVADGVVLGAFAMVADGMYFIDRPAGGGGIIYIDRPAGESRLRYLDFTTHQTKTVARNLGNTFLGLTGTPDGRTILFSRVDSSLDELMLVEHFR